MSATPALSIVVTLLADSGSWPAARRAFRAQTIASRLELVIVTALQAAADDGEDAPPRETIVAVPPATPRAEALAAGVRAATADLVVFAEDHAFPEPGWAEALVRAHGDGPIAVGPAIANANPRSALSWGNLVLGYGPWLLPLANGLDELPAEHASYRREVLLEHGDGLAARLAREGTLQAELRSSGHELVLEPGAVVLHLNASTLAGTLDLRVNAGRLYAATRARRARWSTARRLLYAVASPLIPVVRFVRITRELRDRSHELTPRIVSGIAVAVAFDGVGQLIGYAAGPGRAAERIERIDLDRMRFCSRRDRDELPA